MAEAAGPWKAGGAADTTVPDAWRGGGDDSTAGRTCHRLDEPGHGASAGGQFHGECCTLATLAFQTGFVARINEARARRLGLAGVGGLRGGWRVGVGAARRVVEGAGAARRGGAEYGLLEDAAHRAARAESVLGRSLLVSRRLGVEALLEVVELGAELALRR